MILTKHNVYDKLVIGIASGEVEVTRGEDGILTIYALIDINTDVFT